MDGYRMLSAFFIIMTKELELAYRVNRDETFIKNQIGEEKYNQSIENYKNVLKEIQIDLTEKMGKHINFFQCAEVSSKIIDDNPDIDNIQKSYIKTFLAISAFYLEADCA